MLLADPDLRGRSVARAVSFLEVYYIGRDELIRIASHFYDVWARLRRRIIFLALKRFLGFVARTLATQKRKAAKGFAAAGSAPFKDTRMLSFVKQQIAGAGATGERQNNIKVVGSARSGGDRIDAVLSAIGALRLEVGNVAGTVTALKSEADKQQEMLLSLRNEVQSLKGDKNWHADKFSA